METIENIKSNHLHLGKKIERVRRLRGMTQTELGQLLGITKQAVSKMEQTEKIDDERLEKIASALGVTTDGLKEYNEETVLYNTNNFYENCGVKNAIGNNQTFNNFPIEQTIELFEKLLEKQKEQFKIINKYLSRYPPPLITIDNLYKTLNFVYNNYFPKEVVDELISSKNKEIDWLKIEIKNLKQERETLLQIIRDMY